MSILHVSNNEQMLEAAPDRAHPARSISTAQVMRWIISCVIILVLVLFILGPLVILFLWAFADSWFYPALLPQAWTFSWWQQILLNGDIGHSILLSFIIAPVVTLVSVVICLPAA